MNVRTGSRCLVVVAATFLLVALYAPPVTARADASLYCEGEQLAVGANWSVCWSMRAQEGLIVEHAFYTAPPFDRRVLSGASVAQIFVPYDTGTPRYHDVAYGLGPAMQTLDDSLDCPDGTLLAGGKVCRRIEDRGVTERLCSGGNCSTRRGESLVLWSSSQMGMVNYLVRWEFRDDGSIAPAVGVTGALQYGDVSHSHNVYWRLDFDIDDPGGDTVQEFWRINPAYGDGSTGVHGWTTLLAETRRATDLATFRKWRVVDDAGVNAGGRAWSYEIIPSPGDGWLRTTTREGFSRGELWLTRARSEERYVSTETEDLLSGYLDRDPVVGEDVVVWYAVHQYHEVRDEDKPMMPVQWVTFDIQPRDFFDANPVYGFEPP